MGTVILSAINKRYSRFSIKIPEKGKFKPGKHCPGKKPFKTSDECYTTCFGTKGACSAHGLPLPCEAQNH